MSFLKNIFSLRKIRGCGALGDHAPPMYLPNQTQVGTDRRAVRSSHKSLNFWIIALTLINLPLFIGNETHIPLLLENSPQWWQWLTHPLVHLSRYHLLLDGLAFLTLWSMLPSGFYRWLIYGVVSLGSAFGAILDPNFTTVYGFGGLSGVGHGLMAYLLVLLVTTGNSKVEQSAGIFALLTLLGKCFIEANSGQVVLASLHLGELGTPLVLCHLGGCLSGILCGLLAFTFNRPKPSNIKG